MTGNKPTAIVAGTNFGVRAHVPALRAAGYEILALIGRDPCKTRSLADAAGIPHMFTNVADALNLRPNVLAITTPPHTHFDMVRQAFDVGAHVVCEKPFTLTLAEAVELAALADRTGLLGLLGHEFRYIPSTALFGRLLDQGAIGTPRMATFIAHGGLVADSNAPRPDWWFDVDAGGGWFGASGSHAVDRIRDWYGEIEGVSAQLFCAGDRAESAADDSFNIRFRTISGVDGVLQSTAAAWGPGLTVTKAVGSRGTLWIDDVSGKGNVEAVRGDVYLADEKGTRMMPFPDDLALAPPDSDPWFATVVLPYTQFYLQLARLMHGSSLGSTRWPRLATFADGVANMRVMEAVQESSANNGDWRILG